MTTPTILFQEEQRFREPWLWVLMIGTAAMSIGVAVWLVVWPVAPGEGGEQLSIAPRYLTAVLVVLTHSLLFGLFIFARLQVEVTSDGLFLRFRPFHRKVRRLDLGEVTDVEAVTYRPIMEYGGWGLRKTRRGTAYNVSGDRGVRLHYGNGCHLLIGSQRSDELAAAIEQLRG